MGAGRYEDKKDHSILCVWRLLQAEARPMGCEPRGFGWSATVEVCSARVTRLVTDLKNHEKFSTRQLVPGTLERPRAGMLANPSMRLVPGTLVGPRRNAGKSGDASGAWHLGESPQECWQIR